MSSHLVVRQPLPAWSWLWAAMWVGAVIAEARFDDVEFFEKQIRPLFAERCYECHGAKKQEAGLRLDTSVGLAKGGESGPAWIAADPEASRIIRAVRRTDPEFEMPPKHPLSSTEIGLLEEWVRRGAPIPLVPARKTDSDSPLSRTNHWSYQPIRSKPLPQVLELGWPQTPVDTFILARLEADGRLPGPDADLATLARRIYFDLVGLPPSPEQIAEFANRASQDRSAAVSELVDRLLASPHFGERWARHWLDVVRYAESVTLRGFIFAQAWRYRDYVIGAFNRDLAFDDFVREQIAGDLLGGETLEDLQHRRIATTFLALGNTNLEEQDKRQLEMDVVDEQLDVIGKAFLGQALSCARCHDHKFDPIPTRDYYAMAGILASTRLLEHANVSKWVEQPLPLTEAEEAAFRSREEHAAQLGSRISALESELKQLTAAKSSNTVLSVLVQELPGIVVDDTQATAVGEWVKSTHHQPFIGEGYRHDDNSQKGTKTLTFHPDIPVSGAYEVRFAYTAGENRASRVPVTVFSADGEVTITVNQQESPVVDGRFISLGRHRFEAAGAGFVLVSNEGTTGNVIADAVQFLLVDSTNAVAANTSGSNSNPSAPASPPTSGSLRVAALEQQLKELQAERKRFLSDSPRRPMAMAPAELKPVDVAVHRRGSVHSLGEIVPRGVLSVAVRTPVEPIPSDASGRLELADWLAAPENPLTARVFVNRVWHWLFGAGLVRSVDNFGTTGDPPSHPELLDDLAQRFVAAGWSVKWLIREIIQSRTYQIAGDPEAETLAADPENRLLAHYPRRRLDAECLRDAMLSISGELNLTMPSGPTYDPKREADYGFATTEPWRSVYLPVFRNAMPEFLTAFDAADPSLVVGARNQSTVAPQALFLMNHDFVRDRARATAIKWMSLAMPDDRRLERLYWAALGRAPTEGERVLALRYVGSTSESIEVWTDLVHTMFASIDFRYLN